MSKRTYEEVFQSDADLEIKKLKDLEPIPVISPRKLANTQKSPTTPGGLFQWGSLEIII